MKAELKRWFFLHRRDLPWRKLPTPYEVWISEVMLQQTQVSVVTPYFERWLERFPNVGSLAKAPIHDVIKMWEGLGYYSRARRLHQGAKHLIEKHDGQLPDNEVDLLKVPGIGPYTVGAILSFAFKKRAVAMDGNVMRVIARLYGVRENVDKVAVKKKLAGLIYELIDDEEPWVLSEALIELGALVCRKKPDCTECPLRSHCLALQENEVESFPQKTKRLETLPLYRVVGVYLSGSQVLLKKPVKGKVMEDLWEFPYMEVQEPPKSFNPQDLPLPYEGKSVEKMPGIQHAFTRFRAFLFPYLIRAAKFKAYPGFTWVEVDQIEKLPFSSGHRKLLANVKRLYI